MRVRRIAVAAAICATAMVAHQEAQAQGVSIGGPCSCDHHTVIRPPGFDCRAHCQGTSPGGRPPPPAPVPTPPPGPREVAAEENRKGLEAMAQRRFTAGIDHFRAATSSDPNQPAYQSNLQRALNAKEADDETNAAQSALLRGDLRSARRHLERAIALSGDANLRAELDRVNRARDTEETRRRTLALLSENAIRRSEEVRQARQQAYAAQAAQQALQRVSPTISHGSALEQLEALHGGTPAEGGAQKHLDTGRLPPSSRPNQQLHPPRLLPPPEATADAQRRSLQEQLAILQEQHNALTKELGTIADPDDGAPLRQSLSRLDAEMGKVRDMISAR